MCIENPSNAHVHLLMAKHKKVAYNFALLHAAPWHISPRLFFESASRDPCAHVRKTKVWHHSSKACSTNRTVQPPPRTLEHVNLTRQIRPDKYKKTHISDTGHQTPHTTPIPNTSNTKRTTYYASKQRAGLYFRALTDNNDGHTHGEKPNSLGFNSPHGKLTVDEPNQGIDRHQNHTRGGCDFFGHSE